MRMTLYAGLLIDNTEEPVPRTPVDVELNLTPPRPWIKILEEIGLPATRAGMSHARLFTHPTGDEWKFEIGGGEVILGSEMRLRPPAEEEQP